MNEYVFAMEFWSTVVLGFVAAPFVVALAKETASTFNHFLNHDSPELTSIPSAPRPSRP
ncbi:MAG TPA: hypothetical protein VHE30_03235 [Polyangiaceae bacterium]|nr:hypothetical protein [Polyangiaceae bacterium]